VFKFLFGKRRKFLDVPIEKREKAHRMLDNIINEPDNLSSFIMTDSLKEYIQGLKAVYEFKEILND